MSTDDTTTRPADSDGAAQVVLSREELRAAVVHLPVARVRVRREVVTEEVSVTVTVRREVLRVEREEIPAGTRAPAHAAGPFVAGGAWEMVLHEERPVVGVEVVPVERVRVHVETVQEAQEVSTDLAVEHVEVTGPDGVVVDG